MKKILLLSAAIITLCSVAAKADIYVGIGQHAPAYVIEPPVYVERPVPVPYYAVHDRSYRHHYYDWQYWRQHHPHEPVPRQYREFEDDDQHDHHDNGRGHGKGHDKDREHDRD